MAHRGKKKAKFERCVLSLKKQKDVENPFAVCTAAIHKSSSHESSHEDFMNIPVKNSSQTRRMKG